jgi:hypothetical protein
VTLADLRTLLQYGFGRLADQLALLDVESTYRAQVPSPATAATAAAQPLATLTLEMAPEVEALASIPSPLPVPSPQQPFVSPFVTAENQRDPYERFASTLSDLPPELQLGAFSPERQASLLQESEETTTTSFLDVSLLEEQQRQLDLLDQQEEQEAQITSTYSPIQDTLDLSVYFDVV